MRPPRADGQRVIAQLDLALDLPLDRQVLAALEFALDDHGLADQRRACRGRMPGLT
jgi:hypothetical protein